MFLGLWIPLYVSTSLLSNGNRCVAGHIASTWLNYCFDISKFGLNFFLFKIGVIFYPYTQFCSSYMLLNRKYADMSVGM